MGYINHIKLFNDEGVVYPRLPSDGLLTDSKKRDVELNPHIIAPDPLLDFSLDDFLDAPPFIITPKEENTMSTDEPSSGLNGRLRPRRSNASSPQISKPKKNEVKTSDRPKRSNSATNTPSKASPNKDDLNKADVAIPSFLCLYCDRKFMSKQTLTKHTRRIHPITSKEETLVSCLFCSFIEVEPNEAVQHMVDSHPNQYFACLDCFTRFPFATDLTDHKLNACDKLKIIHRSRSLEKELSDQPKKKKDKKDEILVSEKGFQESHGFNGIVISCEPKPAQIHDDADIEDNITTNLILPHGKTLGSNSMIDKNAVIVLDDIQWNKRIPANFSFHNADADQILSRLGVVHKSPKTGDTTRRDWFKTLEDATQKFEKCFDTNFYSKVASNVQENLSKFLDGSFNFNPDPDSMIKTRKSKLLINTAEGFPILLACEQFSRNIFEGYIPRAIAPKHKWKWDSIENDKHPLSADQIQRDAHKNNCIITLVSSLDIWTQLAMRRKFEDKHKITVVEKKTEKENTIVKELKEILESREIPPPSASSQVMYKITEGSSSESSGLLEMIGLVPTRPVWAAPPAILSGEWVRPRCYICCACGSRTEDAKSLSSHMHNFHPNAYVQHYEITGEMLNDTDIMKHLYVPPSQLPNRSRPLRGFRDCTKCQKSVTLEDLHQHMLECAGDTPAVRRKVRYRPFGVRRRRTRMPDNTIRKRIRKDLRRQNRQKPHIRPKIRSEVGDAETIRKMLADLPAKRHRVVVNPMNQTMKPRRKMDRVHTKLSLKRRPSDNMRPVRSRAAKDAVPKLAEIDSSPSKSDASSKDEDDKPLKPRLKLPVSKQTLHKESKKKLILRRSKRKAAENTEINVDETEKPQKTQSLPGKEVNQLSIDNSPGRMTVSGEPSNAREHSSRGSTRSNQNSNQNNIERDGATGENVSQPPNNVPLKHSIARLTANSETHDKSVQFHQTFLVQQECNDVNHHIPSDTRLPFENEAVVTKLDKPPLHDQKILDSLQKNKSNKPRKKLTDCIAMLKNKLVEPATGAVIGHASVQCGDDEPLPAQAFKLDANKTKSPPALSPLTVIPHTREKSMEPIMKTPEKRVHYIPMQQSPNQAAIITPTHNPFSNITISPPLWTDKLPIDISPGKRSAARATSFRSSSIDAVNYDQRLLNVSPLQRDFSLHGRSSISPRDIHYNEKLVSNYNLNLLEVQSSPYLPPPVTQHSNLRQMRRQSMSVTSMEIAQQTVSNKTQSLLQVRPHLNKPAKNELTIQKIVGIEQPKTNGSRSRRRSQKFDATLNKSIDIYRPESHAQFVPIQIPDTNQAEDTQKLIRVRRSRSRATSEKCHSLPFANALEITSQRNSSHMHEALLHFDKHDIIHDMYQKAHSQTKHYQNASINKISDEDLRQIRSLRAHSQQRQSAEKSENKSLRNNDKHNLLPTSSKPLSRYSPPTSYQQEINMLTEAYNRSLTENNSFLHQQQQNQPVSYNQDHLEIYPKRVYDTDTKSSHSSEVEIYRTSNINNTMYVENINNPKMIPETVVSIPRNVTIVETYDDREYCNIPTIIPPAHCNVAVESVIPLDLSGKGNDNLQTEDGYDSYETLDLSNKNVYLENEENQSNQSIDLLDLSVKNSALEPVVMNFSSKSIATDISDTSINIKDYQNLTNDFISQEMNNSYTQNNTIPDLTQVQIAHHEHEEAYYSTLLCSVSEAENRNSEDVSSKMSISNTKQTVFTRPHDNFDQIKVDCEVSTDKTTTNIYDDNLNTHLSPLKTAFTQSENLNMVVDKIVKKDLSVSEIMAQPIEAVRHHARTFVTSSSRTALPNTVMTSTLTAQETSLYEQDVRTVDYLPSYTLTNNAHGNKTESTTPIYTLSNTCISATKAISPTTSSSTGLLMSIPETSIVNTSSVYTLAGTTVNVQSSYEQIKNTVTDEKQHTSSLLNSPSTSVVCKEDQKSQVVEQVDNIENKAFTIEEPDAEIARKIAMLPKELVDILGNMPKDHRNQLLNVLPNYVSTTTASSVPSAIPPLSPSLPSNNNNFVNEATEQASDENIKPSQIVSDEPQVKIKNESQTGSENDNSKLCDNEIKAVSKIIDLTNDETVTPIIVDEPKLNVDFETNSPPTKLKVKTLNEKTASLRAVRIKSVLEKQSTNPEPLKPNAENDEKQLNSLDAIKALAIQQAEVSSTQHGNKNTITDSKVAEPSDTECNEKLSHNLSLKTEVITKEDIIINNDEVNCKPSSSTVVKSVSNEQKQNTPSSAETATDIVANKPNDINTSQAEQITKENHDHVGDDSDDNISLALIVKQRSNIEYTPNVVDAEQKTEKKLKNLKKKKSKKAFSYNDTSHLEKTVNVVTNESLVAKEPHVNVDILIDAEVERTILSSNVEKTKPKDNSTKLNFTEQSACNVSKIIESKTTNSIIAVVHHSSDYSSDSHVSKKLAESVYNTEVNICNNYNNLTQSEILNKETATNTSINEVTLDLTDEKKKVIEMKSEIVKPNKKRKCESNNNDSTQNVEENKEIEMLQSYNTETNDITEVSSKITPKEPELVDNESSVQKISNQQISTSINDNDNITISPRRSKRGKLSTNEYNVDNDIQELVIEHKTPYTKKQLIFSKLLLDEKNVKRQEAAEAEKLAKQETEKEVEVEVELIADIVIEPTKLKPKLLKRKKSFNKNRKRKSSNKNKRTKNKLIISPPIPEDNRNHESDISKTNAEVCEVESSINKTNILENDKKISLIEKRKIIKSSKGAQDDNKPKKEPESVPSTITYDSDSKLDQDVPHYPRTKTCYSKSANKRSRSHKSLTSKTSKESYDPYDIDLDEVIGKTERKKESIKECKTKSKKINTKHLSVKQKKTEVTSVTDTGNKEKDMPSTAYPPSDSDGSSKSDVPLKKYVGTKAKKKLDKTDDDDIVKSDKDEEISPEPKKVIKKRKSRCDKTEERHTANLVVAESSNAEELEEQMRSEQFMEKFGFFSERKPRKSNLLASKKISETFHIIANDDLESETKERTCKRIHTERRSTDSSCDSKSSQTQTPGKKAAKRGRRKRSSSESVPAYCNVCNKEFRRTDNFLRHQMTLLHISKLSEIELKIKTEPVPEEPNYLIVFKQHLERLKLLTSKLPKRKKNQPKIPMPSVEEILVSVKKTVREQLLSRDLSGDEVLFLDCCELLKESHKNSADMSNFNKQFSSYIAAQSLSSTNKEESKFDSKSDGDVDSITAKIILESEEVRNLENDLISGLKEAANYNLEYQKSLNSKNSTSTNNESTPSPIPENHDFDDTESFETLEPSTTNEKKFEYKEKMYPDEVDIDLYEDKFDKIKRKCRSQAAAAKIAPLPVETSNSHKSRKKSDKKKLKKSIKKSHQTVLTKGALKGFDGIKVSIPKADINLSNIIPPGEGSSKRKKKNSSKKKREKKSSESSGKYESDHQSKETNQKKLDVYEFMDNDDAELFEFRPSTLMERFKSLSNNVKETVVVSSKPTADDNSSTTGSDGDDFVYMSDDYVCSEEETESSLMSCEVSSGKVGEAKKTSHKKKESVEKSAVMGKIFKNNAVRSEKKSAKNKEPVKQQANLDQLFDSLLEEEPSSSMLNDDSETSPIIQSKISKSKSKSPPYSSVYDFTNSNDDIFLEPAKKESRLIESREVPKLSIDSKKAIKRKSLEKYEYECEPSTSKLSEDSSSVTNFDINKFKSYDESESEEELRSKANNSNNLTAGTPSRHQEKPTFVETLVEEPEPSQERKRKPEVPSKKLALSRNFEDESPSVSYEYTNEDFDKILSVDTGVARQRARRKCAVGKQNVLAESWSSESEADGAGADSRRRKGKRRERVGKGQRKPEVDYVGGGEQCRSVTPERGTTSNVAPRMRVRPAAPLAPPTPPAPHSEGAPPQHGWIVGDSHKKLVTMLAHAKRRKPHH